MLCAACGERKAKLIGRAEGVIIPVCIPCYVDLVAECPDYKNIFRKLPERVDEKKTRR